MEEQISPNLEPQGSQLPPSFPVQNPIGDLEAMKQRARELAIAQYYAQQQARDLNPEVQFTAPSKPQPQVIYVRRNLTVAEILVIFLLACGAVTGTQFLWNAVSEFAPRLELKIKN